MINTERNTFTGLNTFKAPVELAGETPIYFGDPNTNGSWRIIRSGDSLLFQRRINGTWKDAFDISALD